MPAGPPMGNKNAEKFNLKKSVIFFNKAIELANQKELTTIKIGNEAVEVEAFKFDFIGEVAREMGSYKEVFTNLVVRHPSLKRLHSKLVNTLEANCYYNTKKGNIREATGIVNLKSNHKWTDRADLTTQGEKVNAPIIVFKDAD